MVHCSQPEVGQRSMVAEAEACPLPPSWEHALHPEDLKTLQTLCHEDALRGRLPTPAQDSHLSQVNTNLSAD